jgi:hypothetical protein
MRPPHASYMRGSAFRRQRSIDAFAHWVASAMASVVSFFFILKLGHLSLLDLHALMDLTPTTTTACKTHPDLFLW